MLDTCRCSSSESNLLFIVLAHPGLSVIETQVQKSNLSHLFVLSIFAASCLGCIVKSNLHSFCLLENISLLPPTRWILLTLAPAVI
jgi:hypothetical protein